MKQRKTIIITIAFLFSALSLIYSQQSIVMVNASGVKIGDFETSSFWHNVSLTDSVNTLSVAVDLSHNWISDLEMLITNPDGQSVTLFSAPGAGDCFGCSGNDLNVVFQDISENLPQTLVDSCGNNPAFSGDVQALGSLDALLNGTIDGKWFVYVKDFWPGEKGNINTITLIFDKLSAPLCTSLLNPLTGSTDIAVTTDLNWDAVENATGYKLSLGTSAGGTEILDGLDVGNVTVYDPDTFPCGSPIFVSLIPYNAAGEAVGCAIDSFTTESITAVAGDDVEICIGDTVQLTASGGTIFYWSPSGELDNPNIFNPLANPSETTTYILKVSNDNGCFDFDSVTVRVSEEIIIVVDSIYHVRVDRPGFIEISIGDSLGQYSYSWSGPNDFSSSEEDISGLEIGCYTLTVTDTLTLCTRDTLICIDDLTGTADRKWNETGILIYPNPASSQVHVDFSNSVITDAEISIYAFSGRMIKSTEKKRTGEMVIINTEKLKSGLYLLKIQSIEGIFFRKVAIGN